MTRGTLISFRLLDSPSRALSGDSANVVAGQIFKLLDGGLRDGGWMGEGRPKGGHALAILPGLTHHNVFASALFAAVTLALPDGQTG
jgi:hypothetical protein